MTAAEIAAIAQPIVAALAAIGQIVVVAWGIRAVTAANEDRAAAAAASPRRADKQRHIEAMAALGAQRMALETLIERTAPGASDR